MTKKVYNTPVCELVSEEPVRVICQSGNLESYDPQEFTL